MVEVVEIPTFQISGYNLRPIERISCPHMPRARSLVLFFLSLVIPITLSLVLYSYNITPAVTLHKLLVPDSASPRQRQRAHDCFAAAASSATMLHYEKNTHIMTDPIAPSSSTPMAPATSANTTAPASSAPVPQHRHIWIITGPAGCGKTSVAEYLASYFTLPYLEGDAVSPDPNPPRVLESLTNTRISHSSTLKPTSRRWQTASPSPTPTAGTG